MMGIAALNPSYVLSHSRVQASRFLPGRVRGGFSGKMPTV